MSDIRKTARYLVDGIDAANRRIRDLGTPQLGNSAIESGKIEEYDQDGSLVQIVGEQHDGTHTAASVNGPVPPEPVSPDVTAGYGSVEGRWSGKFAGDAVSPMDFSHVALHGSRLETFVPSNDTHLATITGELGDRAVVLLDSGPWSFLLVAVSKSGKWSEPSDIVTLDVPDYPSPVDIQDALVEFDEITGGLITEAGNLGSRLDQAETDLSAHDDRLVSAEQRVDDAFIKADGAATKSQEALTAASNAQGKADTAKSAADQAAADALAAAGLAGSKGEVIYQLSAPTGTRANPANLWIRTTDNKPHTYNTTSKTWVAVTDKAATDAATAAANAKTAADAAAQAAANAQAAAGSAQNTADSALTMAGTKGKVFYGTTTPSGTGTAQGDLWRRIDASKNVIGEWYWTGSAWQSSQITTSAIANLDVGKLTVGTGIIADLVAQTIAASTASFQTVDVKNLFVTTGTMAEAVINKLWADVVMSRKATFNMLAVGDFQNYLATGLGHSDEPIDWAQGLTPDFVDIPAGHTVSFKSSAGQGTKSSTATFFDVNPGDEYEFVIWVKADKPNSRMFVEMRDQDGGHAMVSTRIDDADLFWGNSSYPVNSAPVPTTWTKWRARMVPKAGVRKARVGAIYFNHSAGTERGAVVSIAGFSVKRRFGGEVIVDGGVKAKQIDVEDLAANNAFIADLTARIVKSDVFYGKEFYGGRFVGTSFETDILPDRGIKLNENGLLGYDAEGTPTMQMTPGSGVDFMGFYGSARADNHTVLDGWLYSLEASQNYVFFRPREDVAPFKVGDKITVTFKAKAVTATQVQFAIWNYPTIENEGTAGNIAQRGTAFTIGTAEASYSTTVDIATLPTPYESWVCGLQSTAGDWTSQILQENVGVKDIQMFVNGVAFDMVSRQQYAGISDQGEISGQSLVIANETRLDGLVVIGGEALTPSHYGGETPGDNGPVIIGRSLVGKHVQGHFDSHPGAQDYTSWMDGLPFGLGVRGYRDAAGLSVENQEREIMEISYDNVSIRAYRINIMPWSVYLAANVTGFLNIYRTNDGSRPTMNSANLFLRKTLRNQSSGQLLMDFGGVFYDVSQAGGRVRYLFTFQGEGGKMTVLGSAANGGGFRVWIEDMGLIAADTGTDRTAVRAVGGATPPPSGGTPIEPPKKTYTKTWAYSWSEKYKGDGSVNNYSKFSGKAVQGYNSYASSMGRMRSLIGFPSFAGTLNKSSIDIVKVEVYVYAEHWYASSGGTLCVGVHANPSRPGSFTVGSGGGAGTDKVRQKMKKPEGRWITLPSSVHAGFKAGTLRGITVSAPSNSSAYYGYLKSSSTKIRVTYKQ